MSSHSFLVRSNLQIKPGSTLPVLMQDIASFLEMFHIRPESGSAVPDYGDVYLNGNDQRLELDEDGSLHLVLECHGPGHGIEPDGIDDLCAGLESLVVKHGWLEVIDMDTTAANEDEAICVRFLGPNQQERNRAQLIYGIERARVWVEPIIGAEGVDDMLLAAQSSAGLQQPAKGT